jgi:hypothetical protein
MKIAELINNYPNRSRIRETFIRESRGNYKYGDKTLKIISEGNKFSSKIYFYFISIVKYLNNLLSFDDFIDSYG